MAKKKRKIIETPIEEPTPPQVTSEEVTDSVVSEETVVAEIPSTDEETPLASPENSDNNTAMPRSRVRRTVERQSKKTFFLTTIGILLLLGLLIFYGPQLLIQLSLILGDRKEATQQKKENQSQLYIAPPILDEQPSATNSAKINISGNALEADQIRLYVNEKVVDVTKPAKDNSFEFTNIQLKEGENVIQAVAIIKDQKSGFSDDITITYLKEPPELTIESPENGAIYTGGDSMLTIKGKTDPSVRITINGNFVIMRENGNFSHEFQLQNGDNKITIVATDDAGNRTEKELSVKYE